MFHKPFKVKSRTSIKGSVRKHLRSDVQKVFPGVSDDQLSKLVPMKDEMTICKLSTYSGDNITVYCVHKNPLLFEHNDQLWPTVYALWLCPDMLPTLTTYSPVVAKMASGADLMLPGVVIPGQLTPHTFGALRKAERCAVNLVNNRAPIAVGRLLLSGEDMYASAMRGKGLQVMHIVGDELWRFGDQSREPELGEPSAAHSPLGNYDAIASAAQALKEQLPGFDSEVTLSTEIGQLNIIEDSHSVEGVLCRSESPTQEDMDDLLYQAFRCAIKSRLKKSDLPVLVSSFYAKHLLPCCPEGKELNMKKTSYKKFSKFLLEMQKMGLVFLQDLTPGVTSITEIDQAHSELHGINTVDVPDPPTDSTDVEFTPPEIQEMYCITGAVVPVFKPSGYRKGDAVTLADVRQVIKDYVQNNQLQSQDNKKQVSLDPVLAGIILERGEADVVSLTWEKLGNRFVSKLQAAYQVSFPGLTPIIKKGSPDPIVIDVKQRASNKKVTLVENLEIYGIPPEQFAHDVQIAISCSTSVSDLPQKGRGKQVMVQGNQINYIASLLTDKYNVNKKYIRGLEKAPKSSRRK